MSAASTRCTCISDCGDCPGIRAGKTAPCETYAAAAKQRRLHFHASELLAALQPFVQRNSSDETIAITVRTEDVKRARTVIAAIEGAST